MENQISYNLIGERSALEGNIAMPSMANYMTEGHQLVPWSEIFVKGETL